MHRKLPRFLPKDSCLSIKFAEFPGISQDFLQIILARYKDEFDISIKNMNDNPPPRYSRWYDKNYNLHTCIEFIKTLEDNEKAELINSFIMSLLSFITNVDDE